MNKNLAGLAVTVAALALMIAACSSVNQSLSKDQSQTNSQLQQYQSVQPVPYYDWSEQRNTLIQIYNAKNEARQTWAVVESITGAALWSCPSVGFPIPADTQLTNPDQIAVTQNGGTNYYDGVVPQMEPDGLYASGATDATYVLCLRPDGKAVPIYTEQKVSTFPFPVHVEDGKIVDENGASTVQIDVKGGTSSSAAPESPKP